MAGRRTSSAWIRRPARSAATDRHFLDGSVGAEQEGVGPALSEAPHREAVTAGAGLRGPVAGRRQHDDRRGPVGPHDHAGDRDREGGILPVPERDAQVGAEFPGEAVIPAEARGGRPGQGERLPRDPPALFAGRDPTGVHQAGRAVEIGWGPGGSALEKQVGEPADGRKSARVQPGSEGGSTARRWRFHRISGTGFRAVTAAALQSSAGRCFASPWGL